LGGITVASEAVTLNGTGVSSAGALRNFSGDNTLASAVTLASASRINSDAGTLTLSGGITGSDLGVTFGGAGNITISTTGLTLGSGALTKDGAGTLLLSADNTFGGAITISEGKLLIGAGSTTGSVGAGAISNSGTLEISRSDALTFANVISGSGAFIKSGAGNLTLSGANDFTGATTVSAGTLTVDSGALAGTSGVTVNGAVLAAVNLNATAGLTLDATGSATLSGAGITLGAVSNSNTTDDALLFSGGSGTVTLTSLAGAGKTRFASNASIGTLSAGSVTVDGGALTVTNLNGGTLSLGSADLTASAGSFGGSIAGSGALTKTGAGTLTLSAASTYSGATTVSAGVLAVSHASGLGTSAGATSVTSGAELRLLGGITVNTLASAVTLASASRINSDAGTLTLSGGITGSDLGITFGGAGNVTVSATGLTLGTGTLTKDGAGTLLLSVANSYSGATTISGGTLKVGIAGALGTGAVSVAAGGTLDLNSQSITNPITLATGATLTGGSLPATSVPTTGVLDVVLTGSATLAKTDAGTLTLVAANTFTGATTATAGKIAIADFGNGTDPSPLGVTSLSDPTKLVLGNGATLEFTGTTATTTSRSFTVNGSAVLAVDAAAAPLTFSSSSIMALDPADPTPELKLTAYNSGVNRFEAQLSADDLANNRGLANLVIDGTGTWVIGGAANRFKNDVRIEAATGATIGLENAALPSGATLAVANNATVRWESGNTTGVKLEVAAGSTAKLDLGANNVVFSNAPVVASGTGTTANFEKQGSGTLTITSGVSAPSFNVAISSGTLSVNGTLGNVTLSSGTRLGGSGTLGAVTSASGSTIAPGNSPGIMNTSSMTLVGNTTFLWEVQDAQAGPGVGGYDKTVISGSLDLTGASASNKIILKINSLASDGVTIGNATNFGPPNGVASIRTFEFASVQTGSSGVLLGGGLNISDVFQFDLSQFTYSDGSASNAGLWSIDWNQTSGAITLTAVPEPSTYGFAMGALALAAAAIRRRKRQAKA
jgi:autotransporter-associated beta strand protein